MKTYVLDTNVCIDAMRKVDGPVARTLWAKALQGDRLLVSIITRLELQNGALASENPAKGTRIIQHFLSGGVETVDFGQLDMVATSLLIQRLRKDGKTLQAYDALIAGHAIALSATLVTSDARLAASITEIDVANWR